MFKNILIVGLGGFVGSALRYVVYVLSVSNSASKDFFSWGTFIANIIGCLLIGLLWGVMDTYDWFSEELRLLLMVGFCGGFTTFSSYALEAFTLAKNNLSMSLLYIGASILLGLMCVYIGHSLIRTVN